MLSGMEESLLVSNKHLERADDLRKRDALVRLPLLGRLDIIKEDNKVLRLALEVDLDLLSFAACHDCCLFGFVGCDVYELVIEKQDLNGVVLVVWCDGIVWFGRREERDEGWFCSSGSGQLMWPNWA